MPVFCEVHFELDVLALRFGIGIQYDAVGCLVRNGGRFPAVLTFWCLYGVFWCLYGITLLEGWLLNVLNSLFRHFRISDIRICVF